MITRSITCTRARVAFLAQVRKAAGAAWGAAVALRRGTVKALVGVAQFSRNTPLSFVTLLTLIAAQIENGGDASSAVIATMTLVRKEARERSAHITRAGRVCAAKALVVVADSLWYVACTICGIALQKENKKSR